MAPPTLYGEQEFSDDEIRHLKQIHLPNHTRNQTLSVAHINANRIHKQKRNNNGPPGLKRFGSLNNPPRIRSIRHRRNQTATNARKLLSPHYAANIALYKNKNNNNWNEEDDGISDVISTLQILIIHLCWMM